MTNDHNICGKLVWIANGLDRAEHPDADTISKAAAVIESLVEALEMALTFVEMIEEREDTHYVVGGQIAEALAKVSRT